MVKTKIICGKGLARGPARLSGVAIICAGGGSSSYFWAAKGSKSFVVKTKIICGKVRLLRHTDPKVGGLRVSKGFKIICGKDQNHLW